jgi:Fe2+ or Zn2+ uptake regulation protein
VKGGRIASECGKIDQVMGEKERKSIAQKNKKSNFQLSMNQLTVPSSRPDKFSFV